MSPWLPWAAAGLAWALVAWLAVRNQRLVGIERRLRLLLDSTPHPLYLRDRQGHLLDCNQSYLHSMGVERERVIGRTASASVLAHSPQAQTFETLYRQAVRSGEAVAGDRTVEMGARTLTFHHWARPLRDRSGEVNGLACGWIDITERKDLQEQLERASQAKTRFLATLSHEVRNPLNALAGLLEIAVHDPCARDASTLRTAHSAGLAVLALIDDALDIACIEAGRLRLNPRPAQLGELVQATCSLFEHTARQKGLQLSVHIASGAQACFFVDPDRLRQILSNLLGNAIKFTDQGQVRVRLKSLGACSGGTASLWLSVSDTGPGIEAIDQKRAFAPFMQLGKAAQRPGSGTGLGLAICEKLADVLGSRLLLRSQPGRGTCLALRLRLPATQQAALSADEGITAHARAFNRATGRALIVEDNPANRLLLARQLAQLGFATTAVASTYAGLRAYRSAHYPLVITDCSLPGPDGYTFTRALRRLEQRLQYPPSTIIGYTARSGSAVHEYCLGAGMDDCLSKPVGLATLRKCLARWLPVDRVDLAALNRAEP
ncbi:hybrid sensor histidine kinase/response regulator [Pseudomonas sp. KNUC1026]|uniref:hybrid sensor histidine kinase/response regulator n=1 Tax=Pseudomonas sp. KNUC1026 TaxID=2893890 RepID=UPI001F24D9E1|nr:ATP-binding protein [Pseudomonas sp. KNUC1026]UFH50650.1 response regulator [Pseudomonas sp. KNUC1026]